MPHVIKIVVDDLLKRHILSRGVFLDFNLFHSQFHFKRNSPSKVSSSDFYQTALQNYTLFFIVHFVLGSYSISSDSSFRLLILLSDVVSVLFSKFIPIDSLDLLQHKIYLFLEEFICLFPEKVTPKVHFLSHFVTFIRHLGPPSQYSCLRFKGFQKYFEVYFRQSHFRLSFIRLRRFLNFNFGRFPIRFLD